eukprot:CAMPEP_0174330494 /NCGR_PEP_ID=MMETSP0810-20121108/16726_1 /TAXON_ID=73025 ORGANISM="Eutreptiella gymnastica-like, Strain CCMP1594" /NCGR_SAMPLE_ID=MMETSP0810 /ASSEMBLY_ACC=CAM_ASM_000659 /LENGTH=81 /DNA_ID=CAMNT_0015445703 /DNA_START=94 /DNA_END=340 /DNA_ORIENTATION=-
MNVAKLEDEAKFQRQVHERTEAERLAEHADRLEAIERVKDEISRTQKNLHERMTTCEGSVQVKMMNPSAKHPVRATDGAAG